MTTPCQHNCNSFPASASLCFFFFFNDTATTEIYTLSLHDALPISLLADSPSQPQEALLSDPNRTIAGKTVRLGSEDRKSTRLNSSHANISYAVFCLKKKKNIQAALVLLAGGRSYSAAAS